MSDLINCSVNKFEKKLTNSLFDEFDLNLAKDIYNFHKNIPGYEKTPLNNLKEMAKILKVDQIWNKDESKRFELNAFKFLGVIYGIAKIFLEPNQGRFDPY